MSAEQSKIVFELPNGEVASAETLWARRLNGDLFELANIPALAYGVNVGDVVRAVKRDDGRYHFEEVVRRGGHRTFRVAPSENAISHLSTLRELVLARGGRIEKSGDAYYALDFPPGSLLQDVISYLEQGAEQGDWEFEESGETPE